VNLSGTVAPGFALVNAAQNYTFSGTGSITGGTLRKDGSGMLTLATTNTYPGLTDLRNGVLVVTGSIGSNSLTTITPGPVRAGVWSAEGSNATSGTQVKGCTLDVIRFNLGAEHGSVQCAGVGSAGWIINNGAAQTTALTKVTLTGDTTFGGSGRWDL